MRGGKLSALPAKGYTLNRPDVLRRTKPFGSETSGAKAPPFRFVQCHPRADTLDLGVLAQLENDGKHQRHEEQEHRILPVDQLRSRAHAHGNRRAQGHPARRVLRRSRGHAVQR